MDKAKKPTLLVVDDTPDILHLVMELLNKEYNLKLINDPLKAIEMLKTKPNIDLMLFDIMMPQLDGYELCKIVKEDSFYTKIPIIFLTALEKSSDIIKGFEIGAVDYVTKPFIPEVLKARIKTHIELKLTNDALREELEEKEKMLFRQSRMTTLGEMFENVTHQWKQPLSIINVGCGALKMSYEFDELSMEDVVQTIDMVISETDYLTKTIDDFRDFSREDNEREESDIHTLFEQALEILSFRFDKTDIEIFNNIQNYKFRTYKNFFIQVLINILDNSVDALQKSSSQKYIRVDSILKDDLFILKICDNGGGIKMQDPEAVFQKYATTKDKKANSGLGLYMTREILQKKLDAEIVAYNQEEGACFELSFKTVYDEEEIEDALQ
jgi:DNA-binding response OmpR family regulator